MNLIGLRSAILFFGIFFQGMAICTASLSVAETLPQIDAHRFDVKPIQKSTSGKIYLFESSPVVPKTGNLILVYEKEKPAMAFRVLKNDRTRKTFVGKRVRRYDQTGALILNSTYSSLEKLADVLPPPPTETASESLDDPGTENSAPVATAPSKEITEPAEQDPALDSGAPAALDKIDESTASEDEENLEDEEDGPKEYDETSRIEPYRNIFSVTAGYLGNSSNFVGSTILNNGFGMSYAHVLFNDVFIMKKAPQDSLALELGASYYRIVNKDGGQDIYPMLPFYSNLLYQLHLSQIFSLNLYGGIQYNYMLTPTNPGASLDSLQGFQPNFGVGFFYTIGPQWYLRADIGWDRITGGLSIKW